MACLPEWLIYSVSNYGEAPCSSSLSELKSSLSEQQTLLKLFETKLTLQLKPLNSKHVLILRTNTWRGANPNSFETSSVKFEISHSLHRNAQDHHVTLVFVRYNLIAYVCKCKFLLIFVCCNSGKFDLHRMRLVKHIRWSRFGRPCYMLCIPIVQKMCWKSYRTIIMAFHRRTRAYVHPFTCAEPAAWSEIAK